MIIGYRLRAFREAKKLSQGDIERRTGLLRSYVSRVENGHTVPSIETLEKLARALEIPLYQLFHDGDERPDRPKFFERSKKSRLAVTLSNREDRLVSEFRALFAVMEDADRWLLLHMAEQIARTRAPKMRKHNPQ